MKGNPIRTTVLSVKMIPNADPMLLKALKVPKAHQSLGVITTDCDDVSYAALDEATKKADVQVAYAKSMYAGSKNASTALTGEFIGILSGPNPSDVKSGLDAAIDFCENVATFYSANDEGSVVYFAHCISRTGSYLSKQAKVPEGTPMAYLIAPPLEATLGLDAALKAAEVEMKVFYGPPTEANFAGGLLVREQGACRAAWEGCVGTVCEIAGDPTGF